MSGDTRKRLIIYKASAGAGKTYKLSQRYVNLLKSFAYFLKNQNRLKQSKSICGKGEEKPSQHLDVSSLDSIVAITFTNKAAAEMKERVLKFLKEIAKAQGFKKKNSGFELEEEEALDVLVSVIENFSDFHITTIDSFMNRIFKAFAVDLNVYPDYDITFEEKEVFDIAVSELFLNEGLKSDLLNFLDVLLQVEKEGFDGERIIRKALNDFKGSDLLNRVLQGDNSSEFVVVNKGEDAFSVLWSLFKTSYENRFGSLNGGEEVESFKDGIGVIKREMQSIFKDLKNDTQNTKGIFHGTKTKWLNKDSIEDTFNATIWKNMLTREGDYIDLILSKKGKDKIPIDLRSRVESALARLHFLFKSLHLFKSVYNNSSAVEVYKTVLQTEEDIKKALNLVVGGKITERVKTILDNYSLPYAFCRLGEDINHYLIDEFQDTSDTQFDAMCPLIHNALSEGGSLFVVGDKKQAIYGWRGGDYRVFDRIEGENEECSLIQVIENEEYENTTIKENYRSGVNIVEFNNSIFENAKQSNAFLKDFFNDERDIEEAFEEVKRVFADCKQRFVSKEEGYVEVHLFKCLAKNGRDNEVEEKYKPKFFEILDHVLKRFPQKDIMILGRRKKDLEKVVEFIFDYNINRKKDVSFITEDSLKLLNNKDITNLLVLAGFFINPADSSLFRALGENNFFPVNDSGVFFEELDKLDKLNDKKVFSFALAKAILEKTIDKGFSENFVGIFEDCFNSSKLLSPYEFFIKLISSFNFPECSYGFDLMKNSAYFDRLLEVVLNQSEKGNSIAEIVEFFYQNRDITLSMPENIDAIRLMTIHKAKGLESEVVIIPFYDWDMFGKGESEYIALSLSEWFDGAGDKKVVLKNDERLRDISLKAGKEYFKSRLRRFVESLNLMYVANTRPKSELYIIGGLMYSDGFTRIDGHYKTSACVLKELAGNLLEEFEEEKLFFYRTGEKKKALKEVGEGFTEGVEDKAYSGIEFADTIRRDFKSVEEKDYEFDYKKERFGDIFHLTMSFVKGIKSEGEIGTVVESAYQKALKLSGFAKGFDKVKQLALQTVFSLKDYFVSVEKEWNEKEVISKKGFISRLDRLVLKDNEFVIIDYKTGAKSLEKHEEQVKNYMKVFKHKGFKVRGIVYYTEGGEIIDVKL